MLFRQRWRGAVSFVGLGIKSIARLPDEFTATITAGVGVPTANVPDGSLYIRQDGTTADDSLYQRIGGAWVALINS